MSSLWFVGDCTDWTISTGISTVQPSSPFAVRQLFVSFRLRLSWLLTHLLASWPLQSTRNWLYQSPQLGVHINPIDFCNWSLSNPDDWLFSGITTPLWPNGIWYPHKIVSVTVKVIWIAISEDFVEAISTVQFVHHLAHSSCVVMGRKGVTDQIPYVKCIWNCKSH